MTRLHNPRTWIIAAGVIAAFIAVLGYLVLISPQRDETSSVRTQVGAAQDQSDVLQQKLIFLAKKNQDLKRFQAALAQAQLALPATSAMPQFLQAVQTISNATHTSLTGLTVGSPTAMTQSATPAAGGSSTPAPAQTAASSPTGVYSVAISAQVTGERVNLAEFLRQLQSVQPRAVLITQLTEGATAGSAGGQASATTLSISMQAFVSPASAPDTAQPSATPSPGG